MNLRILTFLFCIATVATVALPVNSSPSGPTKKPVTSGNAHNGGTAGPSVSVPLTSHSQQTQPQVPAKLTESRTPAVTIPAPLKDGCKEDIDCKNVLPCIGKTCRCVSRVNDPADKICKRLPIPNESCSEDLLCEGDKDCTQGSKCNCKSGYTQSSNSMGYLECEEKKIPPKGNCSKGGKCIERSKCEGNFCVCELGYKADGDACRPVVSVSLNASCNDYTTCAQGFCEAENGQTQKFCRCRPPTVAVGFSCITPVAYEGTCGKGEICMKGFECIGKSCICPPKTQWNGIICQTVVELNGKCDQTVFCEGGSECIKTVCTCPSETSNGKGVCQKNSLNQPCLKDSGCIDGFICNTSKQVCECPDGQKPEGDNKCVMKQVTTPKPPTTKAPVMKPTTIPSTTIAPSSTTGSIYTEKQIEYVAEAVWLVWTGRGLSDQDKSDILEVGSQDILKATCMQRFDKRLQNFEANANNITMLAKLNQGLHPSYHRKIMKRLSDDGLLRNAVKMTTPTSSTKASMTRASTLKSTSVRTIPPSTTTTSTTTKTTTSKTTSTTTPSTTSTTTRTTPTSSTKVPMTRASTLKSTTVRTIPPRTTTTSTTATTTTSKSTSTATPSTTTTGIPTTTTPKPTTTTTQAQIIVESPKIELKPEVLVLLVPIGQLLNRAKDKKDPFWNGFCKDIKPDNKTKVDMNIFLKELSSLVQLYTVKPSSTTSTTKTSTSTTTTRTTTPPATTTTATTSTTTTTTAEPTTTTMPTTIPTTRKTTQLPVVVEPVIVHPSEEENMSVDEETTEAVESETTTEEPFEYTTEAAAVVSKEEEDSNVCAWIGVGVAVLLLIAVLIGGFFIFCRRKKKKNDSAKPKKVEEANIEQEPPAEVYVAPKNSSGNKKKYNGAKLSGKPGPNNGAPPKRKPKVMKIRQVSAAPINPSEFKYQGPLKISSGFGEGKLEHEMENEKSESLKEKVEFDTKLNEIHLIGTDVEIAEASVANSISKSRMKQKVETQQSQASVSQKDEVATGNSKKKVSAV